MSQGKIRVWAAGARGLLAVIAGCAIAMASAAPTPGLARPHAAARVGAAVIPFTEAGVERVDSKTFAVRWSAPPAAGEVVVLARQTLEGDGADGAGRVVGRAGPTGAVKVVDLPAAARWYFALTPRHGAPLTVADRGLHLASAPNFRDAGGYRTGDGRWVRMGLAYRSDQLDRLSDGDLATLDRLAPALVVDLRTDEERRRGADRLPPGAQGRVLDVMADSPPSTAGFLTVTSPAAASDLMVKVTRQFVSLPSAKAAYTGLFATLETPPGVVVYHCSAGKDRTGWASAVLLTALGVPRETVIADYLASNAALATKNQAAYAHMSPAQAGNLEPVMTVRRAYIEGAFDEVEQRYGSFDAYLRQGLGFDDAALARLKARFLTGAPVS